MSQLGQECVTSVQCQQVGNIVDTFGGEYCGYFCWGILWIQYMWLQYLWKSSGLYSDITVNVGNCCIWPGEHYWGLGNIMVTVSMGTMSMITISMEKFRII